MSDHFNDKPFPRGALIGAAALIGFALIAAAVGRYSDIGTVKVSGGEPVVSAHLRFEDRADGSVVVRAAPHNTEILVIAPGTNGFIRGVMRGLARERMLHEVGSQPPFRLTRWSDGRFSIDDAATGRHIELDPFGPTNVRAFADLLETATNAATKKSQHRADTTAVTRNER